MDLVDKLIIFVQNIFILIEDSFFLTKILYFALIFDLTLLECHGQQTPIQLEQGSLLGVSWQSSSESIITTFKNINKLIETSVVAQWWPV